MGKEYIYSNYTYNSKNPLARFSHRKRFLIGLNIIFEEKFSTILDYGSGDNKFLKEILKRDKNIELSAYEPIMTNQSTNNIKTYTKLEQLNSKVFDVVTCFEVLEHFNEKEQQKMLSFFHKKLSNGGRLLISVPIEIGFPSLIKNIRRMGFGGSFSGNLKNTLKCFLGMEVPEIRNAEGYISSHVGFNHKKLEALFHNQFEIVKRRNSPFGKLNSQLNSQVFYLLKKR